MLVCLGLTALATRTLYRAALIRGVVGEVQVERCTVTGKFERPGRWQKACYFEVDARARVQADCDYWEQTQIGDPIRVVDLGNNDLYLREGGVYASTGNLVFDFVKLALVLIAVVHCLRRWRRPLTEAEAGA